MDEFDIVELPMLPPLFALREEQVPVVSWPAERRESAIVGEPAVIGWKSSPELVCDGVRQLAVVVWARTKLLERTLAGQAAGASPLLACLKRIDVAIAAMSDRLDALEDVLPKRAA